MNDTVMILVLMSLTGGLGLVIGAFFGVFTSRYRVAS